MLKHLIILHIYNVESFRTFAEFYLYLTLSLVSVSMFTLVNCDTKIALIYIVEHASTDTLHLFFFLKFLFLLLFFSSLLLFFC